MKRGILTVLIVIWLACVCGGMAVLFKYETKAGLSPSAMRGWPEGSKIARINDRATLVLFAHPHCPCTRATINELAVLMARCQGKVAAHILFVNPPGVDDNWQQTDLWHSAAAIPGLLVGVDKDGVEARRFQAATSGQAFLFDTQGRLIFSGGITAARGHEGDNAGLTAMITLLRGGEPEIHSAPVFGCSLFNATSIEMQPSVTPVSSVTR